MLKPPGKPTSSPFSPRARLRSFLFAGRGLRWLVRDEHNARLHLAASLGVVVAGFWLEISAADWRWLVLVASIAAALIGVLTLGPPLLARLF